MTRLFEKVLVANRGEIAIRVFRTLRELGIASVAIYSDADRDALHVSYADEAYCVGGSAPADSYLRTDLVLDVAGRSGSEAVHPGYGFLAENVEFARACASTGITFVGPPPSAIEMMGHKTQAREIMRDAGVPIVPGTVDPLGSLAAVHEAIDAIGYPVAVKARAGGGGRGFRVAMNSDELAKAYEGASGEGVRYFNDGAVYLERYLHDPRHVEVQLLADTHGSVVHLGERDCSIQRRHQKLIEETPSPAIDSTQRERLTTIAIDAAKAVGYTNAGTVECLLDTASGESYFLEMNTRVQVEHCVTEEVTGIDIVAEQLRIAAGQPLRFTQNEIVFRGHSIECRINAEDARAGFIPSSGTITHYHAAAGPGVRLDSGVAAGSIITPYYDNLLAKLIVTGVDRESARQRMLRSLHEMNVSGVATLVDFHSALLQTQEFIDGETCRAWIEQPENLLRQFTSDIASTSITPIASTPTDTPTIVEVDGKRFAITIAPNPGQVVPRRRARRSGNLGGRVTAPIPGNVLSVSVTQGERVEAGDILCVLEAMKMENEIAAPIAGTVTSIDVEPGQTVAAGQPLLLVEALT